MKRGSHKRQWISGPGSVPVAVAVAVVIAFVCLWGFTDEVFADNNLPQLVAKAKPAVVFLKAYGPDGKPKGQATGFFITGNGLFVTNYHVMGKEVRNEQNYTRYEAFTADGHRYPVTGVLAEDSRNDLVVARVALPNGVTTPFLKLAENRAALGESIFVISNPKGLGWTVSQGIISGQRRARKKYGERQEDKDGNFDQVAAPFTHGSSGGPVMNMRGEVVSVVSFGVDSMEGAHAQLHFASISPNILAMAFQGGSTVRNLVINRNATPPRELASLDGGDAKPARAGGDTYGAIAYSSKNGKWAWGLSKDCVTREEAEKLAVANCSKRGSGCRAAGWFKNACGALAAGENGPWGSQWGFTKEEAIRKAVERCRAEGGRNCQVRCSTCTERLSMQATNASPRTSAAVTGSVHTFTTANFDRDVKDVSKSMPVLVMFHSDT